MYWADYLKGSKKAKVHVGFDLNRGIPKKIFLTDGKEAERPFVEKILAPGETGVMDRGYQSLHAKARKLVEHDGDRTQCPERTMS